MKNKTKFGMLAIFLIGLTIFVGAVSAFSGRGAGYNQEIQEAVESGDFEAWVEAHNNELTEERFNEVSERHANREQHHETRESMREAIENNDYSAWKEAAESLENYPVDIETITEDDFGTLVEMHNARQSGDFETAHEFAEELGFDHPMQKLRGGRGSGKNRMNHAFD